MVKQHIKKLKLHKPNLGYDIGVAAYGVKVALETGTTPDIVVGSYVIYATGIAIREKSTAVHKYLDKKKKKMEE